MGKFSGPQAAFPPREERGAFYSAMREREKRRDKKLTTSFSIEKKKKRGLRGRERRGPTGGGIGTPLRKEGRKALSLNKREERGITYPSRGEKERVQIGGGFFPHR